MMVARPLLMAYYQIWSHTIHMKWLSHTRLCLDPSQRYPGYLELPYVLHRARCVYEDGTPRPSPPPAYLHTRVLPQVELLPLSSVVSRSREIERDRERSRSWMCSDATE